MTDEHREKRYKPAMKSLYAYVPVVKRHPSQQWNPAGRGTYKFSSENL